MFTVVSFQIYSQTPLDQSQYASEKLSKYLLFLPVLFFIFSRKEQVTSSSKYQDEQNQNKPPDC
jgi:hypothetical protein